MKKAVIYARYSSGSQTEQSIEGQLRVCHKFAKEHDFVIVKEYIDRARTAQNDNRPFFQLMLADSSKKQFDYVIVYAVDRFARDDGDYGSDKKILRINGVKLLSATETIGTNADGSENLGGILTEGILVALAKYYSRELSKKVKRGQFESLQKHNHLGGASIFGYGVKDKKLCIVEEQAEIVRQIFEMYSKGYSAFDIAEHLDKKGIRNGKERKFVPNSIMNMLKNKKYIGVLKYGDHIIEDYHPPIIDKQTFENVQERIEMNKRSPARMKAKENYILSGKLYCGYCKSLMDGESGTSHTGTIYTYYKCFGKKKKSGCKKTNIQKRQLENLVIEATIKHVLNSQVQQQITEQVLKLQDERRNSAELTILQKQLSQTESFIKNLLNAIKKGIISDSTQEELQKLEAEKKLLKEKIIKAEYKVSDYLTRERIEFWFEQFTSFDLNNEEARQYLVTYFINKIILYDDKLIIVYNHDGDNRTELDIDEIETALSSDLEQHSPPQKRDRFYPVFFL
mgnify:CR=1 FL=1